MTDLARLKLLTEETQDEQCDVCGAGNARMYTDAQLSEMLELHGGDVEAAAYEVLLRKSQATDVTLGDLSLADQQRYWLRLAARCRKNQGAALPRNDGT